LLSRRAEINSEQILFIQGKEKMKRACKMLLGVCICLAVVLLVGYHDKCSKSVFSFDVAADMRDFAKGPEYFEGACKALLETGKGVFMVSPGDVDPPQDVYKVITEVLGADYTWYPVVGNHEKETPEDMQWLRNYAKENLRDIVSPGPEGSEETTYSFDHKNAHFVVINEYYDGQTDTGTDGDVCDALYEWVSKDLQANRKPFIFIFGHEPFVSIPDVESGQHRHRGDNLDAHWENSHRFHKLLRKHNVSAYICGHTHSFSHAKINGIWQIDVGHARGAADRGARSTFLKVYVGDNNCWIDAYRLDLNKNAYLLTDTITIVDN
jgi:UDP-2,3-diacylglucosamine pyrophosphatase LpxH